MQYTTCPSIHPSTHNTNQFTIHYGTIPISHHTMHQQINGITNISIVRIQIILILLIDSYHVHGQSLSALQFILKYFAFILALNSGPNTAVLVGGHHVHRMLLW